MKQDKAVKISSLKTVNYFDQYYSNFHKLSTVKNLKGLTHQEEINHKNKYDNRLYYSSRKIEGGSVNYRKNPEYNFKTHMMISYHFYLPIRNPNIFYLN